MKLTELESKICSVLADQLGFPKNHVTSTSDMYNVLGADSLDVVEIVMALEEDLKIEIPDMHAEDLGCTANKIANSLVRLNLVTIEETEHEMKMRTDEDYRERFEATTIPVGRRFSVVFECVDQQASAALTESLFGKDKVLVAGCTVQEIANRDLHATLSTLQQNLKALVKDVL
jgi:acyl carrier protein